MNVTFHLQYWATNFDPIVWLRVCRVLLFIVAGVFMWFEPFQCGGKNKTFHRLVGSIFIVLGGYQFVLARNRMILLRGNGATGIGGMETLIFEVVLTLLLIAICIKLGYDFYLFKELKNQDRNVTYCNHECEDVPLVLGR